MICQNTGPIKWCLITFFSNFLFQSSVPTYIFICKYFRSFLLNYTYISIDEDLNKCKNLKYPAWLNFNYNVIISGYWLFHCHIDFHAEIGMSLVFKIGEHSDFLPVPTNFPKCGDWLPNHDAIDTQEEIENISQEAPCSVFHNLVQRSVGAFINLESQCADSSASWVFNIYRLQIILYVLVRSI